MITEHTSQKKREFEKPSASFNLRPYLSTKRARGSQNRYAPRKNSLSLSIDNPVIMICMQRLRSLLQFSVSSGWKTKEPEPGDDGRRIFVEDGKDFIGLGL